MKHLLLISDGNTSTHSDFSEIFNRELSEESLQSFIELGKEMAIRKIKPDIVYCSPATGSLQAARIISSRIGLPSSSTLSDNKLLTVKEAEVFSIIYKLHSEISSAAIILPAAAFNWLAKCLTWKSDKFDFNCHSVLLKTGIRNWSLITDLPMTVEYAFYSEQVY